MTPFSISQARLITLIYALVWALVCFKHEIGLDEAYHYLIARDSSDVENLYDQSFQQGSGHPVTWNILLMLAAKYCSNVWLMKAIHGLFAIATAWLVARYSPMRGWEKIAIIFGYFFFYEYGVISKNYMPGFFFLFLGLVIYSRGGSPWKIALMLGIAACFHLFTLILSVGVWLYIAMQRKTGAGAWIVFGSLLLMSIIQSVPPVDVIKYYRSFNEASDASRIARAVGSIGRGVFNVPVLSEHFWNTNLISNMGHHLMTVISAFIVVWVFWNYRSYPKILAFIICIPATLMVVFLYNTPLSCGVRYWGYYYLIGVIAVWLQRTDMKPDIQKPGQLLFHSMIILQLPVALFAIAMELVLPFSSAENATRSLKSWKLNNLPIAVESQAIGLSIAANANTYVYYPSKHQYYSFNIFMDVEKFESDSVLFSEVGEVMPMADHDSCVVISNRPLNTLSTQKKMSVKSLASFSGSIVRSEDCFLYLVIRKKPSS